MYLPVYAAPFVLLAGLVFTVLSLVPKARRWAIPIPTGILGAGPSALLGLGAVAFWMTHPARPMGRSALIPFVCCGASTGLLGGVITWVLARWAASILPALLLRGAVLVAAWCSYFVVLAALLLWGEYRFELKDASLWFGADAVLALIGAWFLSLRAEQFRPRRAGGAAAYS
jgi:hypothetical protein